MRVSQLIAERYGIEVLGSNYPVHPLWLALASLAVGVRNGIIALGLAGDPIFAFLRANVPPAGQPVVLAAHRLYLTHIQGNKFGAAMGAWFVGNMVVNGMMTTHAFEIYVNGDLVFSKLASGRLPSYEEFWTGLEHALGRNGLVGGNGEREGAIM